MRIYRQISQYWPLTILAGAVVLGIPLLGIRSDINGTEGLKNSAENSKDAIYQGSGYSKSAGEALMFGFEGVSLQAPMFQSWWDASKPEAKLSELKSNTALVGDVWKNTQGTKEQNFKKLLGLRKTGVRILMQVTEMADWVALQGGTVQRHSFTLAKAAKVFSHAKRAGVEKVADMIVIGAAGEEVSMYANHTQRKKMYELAKQYFPGLPIIQRYGTLLEKPEGIGSQNHPAGGAWNEYRFGAEECDVALILLKYSNSVPVDHWVEAVSQQITLIESRHAEAGIMVSVQPGPIDSLQADSNGIISQKDLEVLGTAFLHSASVDGLLFRGLGEFPHDFGSPRFEAQRGTIRAMAPSKATAQNQGRVPASTASVVLGE